MTPTSSFGHGRCIALSPEHVTLQNLEGVQKLAFSSISGPTPSVGDLVEVFNGVLRLLTPNRSQSRTTRWMNQTLHPRRIRNLQIRSRTEALIREFFTCRDFLETRTPLLVPSPGMEPHIRPFEVKTRGGPPKYLPTSPEFAMKRLLVGGLERIFQVCPAFRDEPRSVTHHPEFTMLEWYRAYSGYEQIMRDTEELFSFIATQLHGEPTIPYQGKKISVEPPWPRLQVRDLFLEHAGVDLVRAPTVEALGAECVRLGLGRDRGAEAPALQETWDDLYFKIWLNLIEPRLPANQAVFVTRYPASQAALSVIDQDSDGSSWARRFEAYAGGLEIGNAFEELTDPKEQRSRFLKDMDLRESIYGAEFPRSPIDEGFLEALEEGMPPSGGIAMGVDRIVMLMANEPEIEETIWLPTLNRSEPSQS